MIGHFNDFADLSLPTPLSQNVVNMLVLRCVALPRVVTPLLVICRQQKFLRIFTTFYLRQYTSTRANGSIV